MRMPVIGFAAILSAVLLSTNRVNPQSAKSQPPWDNGRLVVSENRRFLQHTNGRPFFWLADTAWLMFQKLDRREVEAYLLNRSTMGFNVIQAVTLTKSPKVNAYGDMPLTDNNPAEPKITPGKNPQVPAEYDYWDHVDFVIDKAAEKNLYVAVVPTWGNLVREGLFTVESARSFGRWLAERYRDRPNIIWINGGDTRGDQNREIWQALGRAIHEADRNHLMSFHPFGRTQSSTWFHNDDWLDFNMFQSGHRRYDQRREDDDIATWKGEDNWKYVLEDYAKIPLKPTIDGEPSYENTPQGLHDPNEPYWRDRDARRYAYWSVFAGAFGHTYGNNAVMQMHKPNSDPGRYGVRNYWYEAINDPGAGQMQHLKTLILSRPFFERVYDPSMIAGDNGSQYDYVIATRGNSFAFIYTYTGREFNVSPGKITGEKIRAHWYNPRNGSAELIGYFENKGVRHFDPPGRREEGNDWVLVLDDAEKQFPIPGG